MPKYFDDFTTPLVDAIRATKLLLPICGRGPNFKQDDSDYADGRGAVVMATPVSPYVSSHIEILIEKVLHDYVDSDLHWEANLDIVKRYIPSTSPGKLEYSYNFHVTPFERNAEDLVRLRAIKKMLLFAIKSIRKHS